MKRNSLFLTILLLTLTGAALAQDVDYKIYGVVHVSTDLQNNGDRSEVFVASNTNRVGIKGQIETDSELFDVIFQYESQADFNAGVATESAQWANRNSFGGVKGEWGQLIWGRHDTPFKSIGRQVEYFPERVGDARNATTLGDWDQRLMNMVMYTTPVLSEAVTVCAQFAPDQGVEHGQQFSSSAVYSKDGIKVGLAVEMHGKAYGNAPAATAEDAMGIRAIGQYKTDAYSVSGFYQTISNFESNDGVSAQVFGFGASYLVAPEWDVKGQAYMLDPNTDTDDDGAMMTTLGVDYILSKTARLYLAYAAMMNQDAARNFHPFGGGHGQRMDPVNGDTQAAPGNDFGVTAYAVSAGLTIAW